MTDSALQAGGLAVRTPRNLVATARCFLRRMSIHLALIALAITVVVAARALLADVFVVPTESMAPTLETGDWIVVERARFAPTVPFTKQVRLPRLAIAELRDVIVFPGSATLIGGARGSKYLVKRVVGQSGDTLHMRSDQLFRNGIPEETIPRIPLPSDAKGTLWWLKGRGEDGTRFGPAPAAPTIDNWGPIVVPPDSVFVLGDNRHSSVDSRNFGYVPQARVVGKAQVIYFSLRRSIATGRWELRTTRLGSVR